MKTVHLATLARKAPATLAGALLGTATGCVAGAALAALLMVVPAQVRATPVADPHLDAFSPWISAWQRDVARGDAQAVAAATRLPFRFEGRRLDAEGFVRAVWPALFKPALRRCWAQARPQAEGRDRTLHCGAYTLYFEAGQRGWALREFNPEGAS